MLITQFMQVVLGAVSVWIQGKIECVFCIARLDGEVDILL